MEKIWLQQYPAGVPAEVNVDAYPSLVALLQEGLAKHASKPAFRFMGVTYTFERIAQDARALAAHLQSLGLAKGERVAIMMPNVPQYPVAVAAVLMAGCVVVNVNPLYTPRELEHQLSDAGAKAIIILENFAHVLTAVAARVPVQHVVLAAMGDMLGGLKGTLVNAVVRHVKKLVPPYSLPKAVRYGAAVARGRALALAPVEIRPQDVALLQYTGGTTGVSKGAALTHRNLVANVVQCDAWFQPALKKVAAGEQLVMVAALPLYHIFGLTVNLMLGVRMGGCNVLIPNPRDLPALFKALAAEPAIHIFPAVNTLFNAMARHPDFNTVNWKSLMLCIGGGMAVQQATAALWLEKTGCPICEGYGLSETSPVASANPTDTTAYSGTIGIPLPSTDMALLDDDGREVSGTGARGEIGIRGPQVMAGYWQRPDETAMVMTADCYFRTGDVGEVDERGYFRIVDRKKDMILVSGFNVYPNEVEAVVSQMPGVVECAAIGVPDDACGEAVKVVVVRSDMSLTDQQVRDWCHERLTGYKRPRHVEFRADLPKSNVGKILRRELRDAPSA